MRLLLTPSGPQYPGEVQNLENEYEVDTEDEEFLEELSKRTFRLKDGTEFVVDDRTFEVIIDHLEKQSFDEVCAFMRRRFMLFSESLIRSWLLIMP